MAQDTPLAYRNLVIYEIYVRNHGPKGTFAEVEADLPRIKRLGVDVIWFMPIHPIGQQNKKGDLGCPYSIADYRGVNPEYGTREDFARLIQTAHALDLKVMIDVVYNHTAHDSVLVREHPEWFHQDANGVPVTTVPEWSDVIDLKHPDPGLTAYLIETLQGWAQFGVDGFRCDVASLLPLEFWLEAREAVARVKPGVIWMAESVHARFVEYRRSVGLSGLSDGELYGAFDITYAYDIWAMAQAAFKGVALPSSYLELLRLQDAIYPANYIKLRCVENHDQPRIMGYVPQRERALAWSAFEAFNKGAFLIYAGQESGATHTPSLFDVDKIAWGDYALEPFLTALARLKKDIAQTQGKFTLLAGEPAIQAAWSAPGAGLYGVFNISGNSGSVEVQLPDGVYTDVLTGASVSVNAGQVSIPQTALILRTPELADLKLLHSTMMDF